MANQVTKIQARHRYGLIEGAIIPRPWDRFDQIIESDGSHYLLVTHQDGSQERFTSDSDKRLVRV